MSAGILAIEPIVISGCEDDRPFHSSWEDLSDEEVALRMAEIEQKAQERGRIDSIAQMRLKVFTIVKTYIDLSLDDSDVIEHVSNRFGISMEQAETEILVAKSLYGIL